MASRYWDGGYSANPPLLFPLVFDCGVGRRHC